MYRPKARQSQSCFPSFGHSVHKTCVASGSTPLGATTYWLGNVVVCLVDDKAVHARPESDGDYEELRAYETVMAGAIMIVWQGGSDIRSTFFSLFFSLTRVVCFRVTPPSAESANGDVAHSGPLTLLTLKGTMQPGYRALHPEAKRVYLSRL
jgi:hypothetical protein